MPLLSITYFNQLFQTLSAFDVALLTLTTSFVSSLCFRHFEPRSNLPLLILLILVPSFLSIPVSYHVRYAFASVPLAFASYIGSLLFFTIAYRLSPFHPLAKYPGPTISKTSKWWAAYASGRGNLHLYYKRLHDHYGDVVRVGQHTLLAASQTPPAISYFAGPNELSIRDASLMHAVLGQGGLPKGPHFDGLPGRPHLFSQRDPAIHMHQRKPWNRAFSSAALKEYEGLLAKRARQLLGCIEDRIHRSGQKDGVVLDMAKWFSYFATDFMGDMAFGGGFELMRTEGNDNSIRSIIEAISRLSSIMAQVSYILQFQVPLMASGTIQRILHFSRERVFNRLKNGANRKDLFYYLSGEEGPESERPSVDDLVLEGVLAMVAGSDTVNSTLYCALYYLVCNPAVYMRLQEEVDDAFTSGEEPLDMMELSNMEWLNACINETLRLQPAGPNGSQRVLGKGKGAKVLGKWFIPEETELTLHTYSIHRDPRYFHTPDAFMPERWLSEGPPAGEHNIAAFFPFGYGPTICAGKFLAIMEMRMLLCWLLRRFRFSKAPGFAYEGWDARIQDWGIIHCDALLVSISVRE